MSPIVMYAGISMVIALLLTLKPKHYWHDHAKIQLNIKLDVAIVVLIALLAWASIELHQIKESEFNGFTIGSLDQASIEQINRLDQVAAGRWDIAAKDTGKVFKNTAIWIIPLSLLLFMGNIKRRLVLFFIFTQGYLLTEIFTGLAKALVDRYRPFAYLTPTGFESLSAEAKEKFAEDIVEYDILNSFFSGDASILAFGMVFFALAYSIIYRSKMTQVLVWLAALIAVVLGCYYRAMSGKHFPSDVMVGAVVGALVAVIILYLHRSRAA